MSRTLTALLSIIVGCQESPSDAKTPLPSDTRSLERTNRLDSILAPPSRVTLQVVEALLEDVLVELYFQTGHRLLARNIDRTKKISLEVSRVEPWEAFDALCRSSGLSWGLRHSETADEILVGRKGEWADRIRFKGAGVTVELTAINEGCLVLIWTVYHGLAAPFRLLRFEVDELRDDKGTDLSKELPSDLLRSCHVKSPKPPERVRGSILGWVSGTGPAAEARFLSRVKGRLIVEVKLEKDPGERHQLTIPMDLKAVPISVDQ